MGISGPLRESKRNGRQLRKVLRPALFATAKGIGTRQGLRTFVCRLIAAYQEWWEQPDGPPPSTRQPHMATTRRAAALFNQTREKTAIAVPYIDVRGKTKLTVVGEKTYLSIIMEDILNEPELIQACKDFKVSKLHVFGSFAEGARDFASDVDFIVEFDRDGFSGAFEQFMGFKERLEEILERPVDLLANRRFRNEIFQAEIERTKRLIYAA